MNLLNSRRRVLFFSTVDEAIQAEAGRRSFIKEALAANRRAIVRESPAFSAAAEDGEELSETEASAQEIKLRYQATARETLLFGRAADFVRTP
jgi:hypothetical protein